MQHVKGVLMALAVTTLSLTAGVALAADDTVTVQPPVKAKVVAGANHSFLSVAIENDKFTGTDQHYTNGIRMAWLSAESDVPDWAMRLANSAPFFPSNSVKRWGLTVGHSLFTPADTWARTPQIGDRPYSGWLYGGIGFVSDTGRQLDNVELLIGMVGPSAHGETVQNDWHSLIGVDEARGWDAYQLHDEPVISLTYERKWRASEAHDLPLGFGFDVTPHLGVTLGNAMTYAAAGGVVRFGRRLPEDYGPPRIRPSLPGTTFFLPPEGVGWYVFAGLEGRAVARNIFLDGNTFRDSPSVDKFPLVGDFQGGLAITWNDLRLAYTHVLRTKEFRTQKDPDRFGSLSLSARF